MDLQKSTEKIIKYFLCYFFRWYVIVGDLPLLKILADKRLCKLINLPLEKFRRSMDIQRLEKNNDSEENN